MTYVLTLCNYRHLPSSRGIILWFPHISRRSTSHSGRLGHRRLATVGDLVVLSKFREMHFWSNLRLTNLVYHRDRRRMLKHHHQTYLHLDLHLELDWLLLTTWQISSPATYLAPEKVQTSDSHLWACDVMWCNLCCVMNLWCELCLYVNSVFCVVMSCDVNSVFTSWARGFCFWFYKKKTKSLIYDGLGRRR